jgi:hypothetical protein
MSDAGGDKKRHRRGAKCNDGILDRRFAGIIRHLLFHAHPGSIRAMPQHPLVGPLPSGTTEAPVLLKV